jgi:hypothetical protein
MSDKQGTPTLLQSALPGLLYGILIPLITIFTIGLERPLWQLLIFGAVVGTLLGLAYRLITRR